MAGGVEPRERVHQHREEGDDHATTAAFDGQSKPNHITMIGATPTIGSAETKLPSGSSPRPRK